MVQIVLNETTYFIAESSNGTSRTLIDILKNKIVSYLLDDKEIFSDSYDSFKRLSAKSIITSSGCNMVRSFSYKSLSSDKTSMLVSQETFASSLYNHTISYTYVH